MIGNFLVQFLVILFYDILNPVCGVQLHEFVVVFFGWHAPLLLHALINLLDYCCTAKVNKIDGADYTVMMTMIQISSIPV